MEIIKGKQKKAVKVVIYGAEGVGKSTFAANFPDPIFIDTEGSTAQLDVSRTPRPLSWTELMNQVDYFIGHPDELKTLVVDTADWAERLTMQHVCATYQVKGIEDVGYGKGYTYVYESFGKLLDKLQSLIDNGVHVVCTSHAIMRKFEQPDEMGAYDRWELKLSKKVAPMLKEWADMLLFANYETYIVSTSKDGKQAKATGGTKRVMYTEHTATYDAKNRFGLAPKLPFDFSQIAHIFNGGDKKAKKAVNLPDSTPAPATMNNDKPKEVTPRKEPKKSEKSVPDSLAQLMAVHDVKECEIQAVVAQKGYYPPDTPIENYDPAFVQGVLIGAWAQVENAILQNRENVPF